MFKQTQLYNPPLFSRGGVIHEETDDGVILWKVQRRLWPHTEQKNAETLTERLGCEKLLRDLHGWWYLCVPVVECDYEDKKDEPIALLGEGSE